MRSGARNCACQTEVAVLAISALSCCLSSIRKATVAYAMSGEAASATAMNTHAANIIARTRPGVSADPTAARPINGSM